MSLSIKQQQAIYDRCRKLLDIPNFNAIQISQAHKDLKEYLQKTLADQNLEVLPIEVVTIFITAFITSSSALENLRAGLNTTLINLSKAMLQEHSEPKRLKHPEDFESTTDSESMQESQQQVSEQDYSAIILQMEQVQYDLNIVSLLYAQTIPSNVIAVTTKALEDFIGLNPKFSTIIPKYIHKKVCQILNALGFLIEVTDAELIQEFRSYLESNQDDKAAALKSALDTRLKNNFLQSSIILLLAPYVQHPEQHNDSSPTPADTMDFFTTDELPSTEKLRARMQVVKSILVKLGFQFDQSRVNSRASTPPATPKNDFCGINPIILPPPPESIEPTPSSLPNLTL